MLSNLTAALAARASNILAEQKVPKQAWGQLFLANAKNIATAGVKDALTGPLERGDAKTIAKNLAALSGIDREIYIKLSKGLLSTAKEKNPKKDYSQVKEVLKNKN
jgi:predicted short-subunit dehydrogenase-like oxidoreductase (DUF2520 family)